MSLRAEVLALSHALPVIETIERYNLGVSLNGGTPKTPLSLNILSGTSNEKTHGCWVQVPPF